MHDETKSRADILQSVRQYNPGPVEMPSLNRDWIAYADRVQQFSDTLQFVGGTCVPVPDLAAVRSYLQDFEPFIAAKFVYSLLPDVIESTRDISAISDPHDLEAIDLALVPGDFAVAENGAVWVTDRDLKHQRAALFLAQHLTLVVRREELLDNMHQAYQRLQFQGVGFGTFLSGPSKTADIEQSLVIGAHGPRSLIVFLVG